MKALRTYLALLATVAMFFFCVWALAALIRFGSCASGGVYVSSQQCAPGTGLKISGFVLSIFGLLVSLAFTSSGGPRALSVAGAALPGFIASYLFVNGLEPAISVPGGQVGMTDVIVGAVFTLITLRFVWGAVRPRAAAATGIVNAPGKVIINGPTGAFQVHSTDAGGPATIVRATRPPGE